MTRPALLACLAMALPLAAQAQEALTLAEVAQGTHVHGIAAGTDGPETALLATHHGLFAIDIATQTALPLGDSRNDFMGFTTVPGQPGRAFASGHPATGGNLGVIRTDDGGASWVSLAEGVGGPVDFHAMEVSRAVPEVIYGIGHDGAVQRSDDAGASWAISGRAPEGLIDIATSGTSEQGLFAATETGLFQSRDGGASWQRLLPGEAPVSTVDTGPDGRLRAVQLGLGLVEVDPETGAAVTLTQDLPGGYLLYLAVTQTDPLRIMALSAQGALVLSRDGGASWEAAVR